MKTLWVAAILAVAIAAGIVIAVENKVMTQETTGAAGALPFEGEKPFFAGATGWLNTKPLGAADLRGKVVLVEFWTYGAGMWGR